MMDLTNPHATPAADCLASLAATPDGLTARGCAAAGRTWAEPPARGAVARAGGPLPAAVPQCADLCADRCGGGDGGPAALGRYRGDPRRGAGQCGDRLHPGGQGRGGDGGDPGHACAEGRRVARRAAGFGGWGRPCARRHRSLGGGRQGSRRPAGDRGAGAGRARGDPDRRIRAGGKGPDPGRCRCRPWRPPVDAVVGHAGHPRHGARAGGGDGSGDRDRAHRRASGGGRTTDHAAGRADRPFRALAVVPDPAGRGALARLGLLRRPHALLPTCSWPWSASPWRQSPRACPR
jgi:hypothetical protein